MAAPGHKGGLVGVHQGHQREGGVRMLGECAPGDLQALKFLGSNDQFLELQRPIERLVVGGSLHRRVVGLDKCFPRDQEGAFERGRDIMKEHDIRDTKAALDEAQVGIVRAPLRGFTSRDPREEGALHVGMQLRFGDGHTLRPPNKLLVGAFQAKGGIPVPALDVLQPAASPLDIARHALLEA